MHHRLIMVSGSSPGAGKSSVLIALARQLALHEQPCHLLSEDELLWMDGFARFDRELGANDPHAIDALLDVARTFVAERRSAPNEAWITDALLWRLLTFFSCFGILGICSYRHRWGAYVKPVIPAGHRLDRSAATPGTSVSSAGEPELGGQKEMTDRDKSEENPVTVRSGNVFADIGVPSPEEALLKAQLAYQINQAIQQRGLTQTAAAERLGVDQPKVSALHTGRLRGFSVDRLIQFLTRLGNDVEIVVRPAGHEHGETRVSAVA